MIKRWFDMSCTEDECPPNMEKEVMPNAEGTGGTCFAPWDCLTCIKTWNDKPWWRKLPPAIVYVTRRTWRKIWQRKKQ